MTKPRSYSLDVVRLHSLDGDYDDLGWYSKGHHSEEEFRKVLTERLADYRHECEADETKCTFYVGWWRVAANRRFIRATPRAPFSFPVTALLTDEAEV